MHSTHQLVSLLMVFLGISWHFAECIPLRSKRAFSYIANETACTVDHIVYRDGDPIPTDDPCETCRCRPPGFSCVLRECEIKTGCRAIRRIGECCPLYQCGCEHNGNYYRDGERIPNAESPCYSCYCQGSSITCSLADCKFRFDCEPEYLIGECCPRYDHCPPEYDGNFVTVKSTEIPHLSSIFPSSFASTPQTIALSTFTVTNRTRETSTTVASMPTYNRAEPMSTTAKPNVTQESIITLTATTSTEQMNSNPTTVEATTTTSQPLKSELSVSLTNKISEDPIFPTTTEISTINNFTEQTNSNTTELLELFTSETTTTKQEQNSESKDENLEVSTQIPTETSPSDQMVNSENNFTIVESNTESLEDSTTVVPIESNKTNVQSVTISPTVSNSENINNTLLGNNQNFSEEETNGAPEEVVNSVSEENTKSVPEDEVNNVSEEDDKKEFDTIATTINPIELNVNDKELTTEILPEENDDLNLDDKTENNIFTAPIVTDLFKTTTIVPEMLTDEISKIDSSTVTTQSSVTNNSIQQSFSGEITTAEPADSNGSNAVLIDNMNPKESTTQSVKNDSEDLDMATTTTATMPDNITDLSESKINNLEITVETTTTNSDIDIGTTLTTETEDTTTVTPSVEVGN